MPEREPFGYQKPSLNDQQLAEKLDRVDELVSLMLDDELPEEKVRELEGLLVDSSEARTQYVGMIQLHSDLIDYYNPQATALANSAVVAQLTQSVDVATPTSPPPKD